MNVLRIAAAGIVVCSFFLSGCAPRWIERDTVLNDVIPREGWNARPWLDGMIRHEITHITIHHTAERHNPDRSLEAKLLALQSFSQEVTTLWDGRSKPVWGDVPYHYFIDVHGQIAEARPIGYCGDTNTAYDPCGHALVVLEGNFEEEEPTAGQIASLMRMTRRLASRYDVEADRIGGHNDFAETLCPGQNLSALLPHLRLLVADSE